MACLIVEFIGTIQRSVSVKVYVLMSRITMVIMVSTGTPIVMSTAGVRATWMRENREENEQ